MAVCRRWRNQLRRELLRRQSAARHSSRQVALPRNQDRQTGLGVFRSATRSAAPPRWSRVGRSWPAVTGSCISSTCRTANRLEKSTSKHRPASLPPCPVSKYSSVPENGDFFCIDWKRVAVVWTFADAKRQQPYRSCAGRGRRQGRVWRSHEKSLLPGSSHRQTGLGVRDAATCRRGAGDRQEPRVCRRRRWPHSTRSTWPRAKNCGSSKLRVDSPDLPPSPRSGS